MLDIYTTCIQNLSFHKLPLNQDYTDSAITDSWRDTSQMTLNELTAKRDALAQALNVPVPPTPTANPPATDPNYNPALPVDNTILGMPKALVIGLGLLVVIIGGAIAYKKFGKKGAGSKPITATA